MAGRLSRRACTIGAACDSPGPGDGPAPCRHARASLGTVPARGFPGNIEARLAGIRDYLEAGSGSSPPAPAGV
jgi:hypothetical protein